MRFRQTLRFLLLILILAGVGGVLVLAFLQRRKGPAMEEGEREHSLIVPSRVSTQDGERMIALAPDTQEKSGIVVVPLAPVSYQEEISAYGTVAVVRWQGKAWI